MIKNCFLLLAFILSSCTQIQAPTGGAKPGALDQNKKRQTLTPEIADDEALPGGIFCQGPATMSMPESAGGNATSSLSCEIIALKDPFSIDTDSSSASLTSNDLGCQAILDSEGTEAEVENSGSKQIIDISFDLTEAQLNSIDECLVTVGLSDPSKGSLEKTGEFRLVKSSNENRLAIGALRSVEMVSSAFLTGSKKLMSLDVVSSDVRKDFSEKAQNWTCASETNSDGTSYADICEDLGILINQESRDVLINKVKAHAALGAGEKEKFIGLKFEALAFDGVTIKSHEVSLRIKGAGFFPRLEKQGEALACLLDDDGTEEFDRVFSIERKNEGGFDQVSAESSYQLQGEDEDKIFRCIVVADKRAQGLGEKTRLESNEFVNSDSDGDGVDDNTDAFPNDSNETADSDNDGVGDLADAFPNDPNQSEMAADPEGSVGPALAHTLHAFASRRDDGSVVAWGAADRGGDTDNSTYGADCDGDGQRGDDGCLTNPQEGEEIVEIFGNDYAFAALRADGTVVGWGNSSFGGLAPSWLNTVVEIFSNKFAFAALRADDLVVAWGQSAFGGLAPIDASNVEEVYSTGSAFAAVKADGSVVAWGYSNSGGDTDHSTHGADCDGDGQRGDDECLTNPEDGKEIVEIFGNENAFAALRADGSVVTWGTSSYGGDSSSVSTELSSGVSTIYSTERAFAALKADDSVVTWGDASYGGDSSDPDLSDELGSGVSTIYSTEHAFAALKADDSVVTWGDASYGGDSSDPDLSDELSSGVSTIFGTDKAFAAIKGDGSVVAWGYVYGGDTDHTGLGADCDGDGQRGDDECLTNPEDGKEIVEIFNSDLAVAALRADGSVVAWGYYLDGGDTDHSTHGADCDGDGQRGDDECLTSPQEGKEIVEISSSDGAFAALRADGSVFAWGNASSGGAYSLLE